MLDLFSSRRRAISARAEELCRAFAARHGRDPSPLERTRIAQQATLATRAAKSHDSEDLDARLDRWERECREARDGGLADVARGVLARGQQIDPPATWSERDVIERALAALGDDPVELVVLGLRAGDLRRAPRAPRRRPEGRAPAPGRAWPSRRSTGAVRLDVAESTDGLPAHLRRADGSERLRPARRRPLRHPGHPDRRAGPAGRRRRARRAGHDRRRGRRP